MKKEFKIINKECGYSGFFKLNKYKLSYEKFDGSTAGPMTRELLERGHAAAIIPYDPVLNKVVLIEQFRPGAIYDEVSPWMIEVVAGIKDGMESGAETVCREIQEEAGIKCERLKYVTKFYVSPGGTTETIELFVGKVDSAVADGVYGLACECEDIRVFSVDLDEAIKMLDRGEIKNAIAIISLQYLQLHAKELQQEWI
ncbi:MAG: NUDIX domain-containing protein [Succinivibrionaceae bacterium]